MLGFLDKLVYYAPRSGGVAERLNALVLKTSEGL